MNKSKLFITLKILISVSLLGLLCWLKREKFGEIRHLLKSVDIPMFVLAFLIFTVTLIFMVWRLKIILAVQKVSFAIKDLFSLTLIGYFFNNFMPTSIGGDLVKGYYISKSIKSKLFSYTSVFIDRLVGMFSLILIATIVVVIMRKNIEQQFIFWVIGFLLLSCTVLISFLFNKKLLKKISNFLRITHLLQVLRLGPLIKKTYNVLNLYTNHKRKVLQTLALSLIAQFVAFGTVYLLAISLGVYIPFGKILLIMPIIAILLMLPITFNGLGLREWSFVFFFSTDMGDAAALSLSLLFFAMYLLVSLSGGIIYLFRR